MEPSYNMLNNELKENDAGQTFCNYTTQNVQQTVESIPGNDNVVTDLTRISPTETGEERIVSGSSAAMRQRPTSSNFWSRLDDGSRQIIKIDNNKIFSASFFRQEHDEYIEIDGERFYEDPGPSD